jgi:hypothetical protein
MKLTIVEKLNSNECVVDADTGLADTQNRQVSQPIRLLTPPEPEPTADDVDIRLLTNVLAYRGPSRIQYLAANLETTAEDAASIVGRGDDHIMDYYLAKKLAPMKIAWTERETRRQASLGLWCFRNRVVKVEDWSTVDREEIVLRVKHAVLSDEQALEKLRREVEVFENVETGGRNTREPIPQQVQMFVWQRDEGRCVKCGSQERLEYDHIIPLAKGGSNTERNIQLLCETCNRAKGSSIS